MNVEERDYFYLDDAATTEMCQGAITNMLHTVMNHWGNSNSTHQMGINSNKLIAMAIESIRDYLDAVNDTEVIFTSSGSEANQIVKRVLSKINPLVVHWGELEHSSNLKDYISNENINGDLPCSNHMLVNNETGEVFLDLLSNTSASYIVVSDCTQALYDRRLMRTAFDYLDIITVSFHKVHGSKGLGAIIVNKRKPFNDYLIDLLKNEIHGTMNTYAISTVAPALNYCMHNYVSDPLETLLKTLKNANSDRFKKHKIRVLQDELQDNGHEFIGAIRNIRFEGVNAEALVRILSQLGVYCSSGSACLKGQSSYVLERMGIEHPTEYIRISSHRYIDEDESNCICNLFAEALEIYDDMLEMSQKGE